MDELIGILFILALVTGLGVLVAGGLGGLIAFFATIFIFNQN